MSLSLQNCPHERRPGTTVCLHCRHAERLAARAVRGRIFTHVMLGGAVLGVVAVAVSAAMAAFDGQQQAAAAPVSALVTPAAVQAEPPAPSPVAAAASREASPAPAASIAMLPAATPPAEANAAAVTTPASQASSVTAPAPAPKPAAAAELLPALYPMVPEGTSPLADDMSVDRRGDTVIVHFDTELGRTRRPEKFDAIARATLVQVYGAAAEPVLEQTAAGTIARTGDLLADLPARGIRIPAGDGTTLSIWPITRPGRDGPIVVAYRAIATR